MEHVFTSLGGIINFAIYFSLSLVLLVLFKLIYTFITPYDEWKLVREDKNIAAAIGLVGAIMGFALALASTARNSVSIIDFIIWAVIALIAQTITFGFVRFVLMPSLIERINNNEIAAGIVLGGVSIAVGILNAACITY
ncbi:MAG: DUF350 domain-containing protein [Marinagarivorans sp.]|nr:DUF350 domain-containing protein [Marinagarivorans sp.]